MLDSNTWMDIISNPTSEVIVVEDA